MKRIHNKKIKGEPIGHGYDFLVPHDTNGRAQILVK